MLGKPEGEKHRGKDRKADSPTRLYIFSLEKSNTISTFPPSAPNIKFCMEWTQETSL